MEEMTENGLRREREDRKGRGREGEMREGGGKMGRKREVEREEEREEG